MRTSIFLSLVFAVTSAAGRDTPGTPNNVKAETAGPDAIHLNWDVTSRREESVKFEVEARLNNAPVDVQQPDGTSGTGEGWFRESESAWYKTSSSGCPNAAQRYAGQGCWV